MPKRIQPINMMSDHGSIFNELIIYSETLVKISQIVFLQKMSQ